MAYLGITNYHWIYYGAFPETFHLARHLRRTITPAEKILWSALRNRFLAGYKFRRQHPLREFVVDFFCPAKELVIEIDGGIHQKKSVKERDENRTTELERMGLRVIRFTNEEVMNDIENVMKKIEKALISPSPNGEGAGG